MNNKLYIIILLASSVFVHFLFFGHPNETVFDEVHFGKFVSAYYTQEFYFDIHPALGKIIIAGFAKLSNFQPEFAFANIGEPFPDKQYMVLRFLPTLASSLLPIVIFLLLLGLGIAPFAAFAGGLLIILENALLAQGRFILMDSFMLLFGFTSLLFYLKSKKPLIHNTKYLLLSGLFSGLALSVKWVALSFVALPLAIEGVSILSALRNRGLPAHAGRGQGFKSISLIHILKLMLFLLIVPAFIYFSVFMLDFSLLTKSGTGDAFMSQGFQKTLEGSSYENRSDIKDSNMFQKFTQLNTEMYKANQRLSATHPYSSQWYSWPLMIRPIYYWVNGESRIYLIGNPVIWWASTIAVLMLFLQLIKDKWQRIAPNKIIYILLGAYILNLLPFIGVKRVMFLYHYFTAYIFAILMLVYLISKQKNSKQIFGALLVASTLAFIFFSPLTYGLDMSAKAYEARVWLDSWR